jgi:hypothetical protein
MVKIKFECVVNHLAKEVFIAFRDRGNETIKYIKDLKEVKELERKKLPDGKMLTQGVWMAKSDKIPAILKTIIKPEMLKWKDKTIWDEKNLTCHWEIETFYFNEHFECKGKWVFSEWGKNKTKAILNGYLKIFIPSLVLVPKSLTDKAGEMIEKIVVKELQPNLKKNMEAIGSLLNEKN